MTETTLRLDYELNENQLLINDLATAGNLKAMQTPDAFLRALLRGLIEEFSNKTSAIVVNTSSMSHIDPLEAVGFDIVHEEAHFVTAEYEF